MQRENNFHPDSGICRRLFRYIFNALKVLNGTQGLYTHAKPKGRDDMRIKLMKEDDDAGCEVEILFKKTDETEYDRSKINIDVEEEDKEKKNGKTVISDPPEHPRVLLNVDSNINEKSDEYIRRRKARMRNIDIEQKKY
ncbi:hypothetical protein SLEP1_g1160 [Rubroshorea leprosula]|uniref:Uncharacterized protein n=1 Tax=Rubroshorea leprosula TaxID=152421 RepID=A0AAV5HHM0_9ROSI|nr:hypothetical protein SLEP1_g1160 [Rubroshorea leprosula]